MDYKKYAEYCLQRRRARLRLELKRKARRWDTLCDIAEAAGAVFVLLLLCGWI